MVYRGGLVRKGNKTIEMYKKWGFEEVLVKMRRQIYI